jgi:hypothetical protein
LSTVLLLTSNSHNASFHPFWALTSMSLPILSFQTPTLPPSIPCTVNSSILIASALPLHNAAVHCECGHRTCLWQHKARQDDRGSAAQLSVHGVFRYKVSQMVGDIVRDCSTSCLRSVGTGVLWVNDCY